ncbi:MAG: hypothetical protein M3441_28165, partial [Chloroflexota bacterium]|nr:hypothetical protein [Chloroflexota bacterium]
MTARTREQGRGVGGMSRLIAAWLAWLLWALCLALVVLAVVLVLNTPPVPARDGPNLEVLAAVPF